MDVAAHDGSLASILRNFVGGRRRCRRTMRDDRGFRLGEPSRDSIVFRDLRLLDPPLRRFVRHQQAGGSFRGFLDTAGGSLGGTSIASAQGVKGAVSADGEAKIRRGLEGFAVF